MQFNQQAHREANRVKKKQGLDFFIFWEDIKNYKWSFLRKDLYAATLIALLAIPQCLAYALITRLPPEVALLSAIFATFFAALFVSSYHLVIGPTNAVSLLILAGSSQIIDKYYGGQAVLIESPLIAWHIMMQLTFMIGLVQIFAACFHLVRLNKFISRSVLIGYLLGVCILIILHQLPYLLLDLDGLQEKASHSVFDFYWLAHRAHIPTLFLGFSSTMVLFYMQKKYPHFPNALFILCLGTAFAHYINIFLYDQVQIPLVGDLHFAQNIDISFFLPIFDLRILGDSFFIALAIAILGILEATALVKGIPQKKPVHLKQDIFSLGLGNFCSSFIGAMPCSASPSRTMINSFCQSPTRFSTLLSALLIFLVMNFFDEFIGYIPLSVLSAFLILAARKMVQMRQLKLCFRSTRSDAFVLTCTCLSALIFSLESSFYFGIILSILFYLKDASQPHFKEEAYGEKKDSPFAQQEIRLLQVQGELFFAVSDLLQEKLQEITSNPQVKVIMLDFENTHSLDASSCYVLEEALEKMQQRSQSLLFLGLHKDIWKTFQNARLSRKTKEENLFFAAKKGEETAKERALKYAYLLVSSKENKES